MKKVVLLTFVLGVVALASEAHAQRGAAFALNCIGHVRSDLTATINFVSKVPGLTFTNVCDGAGKPAVNPWPSVLSAYGKVESVTVTVKVRNKVAPAYDTVTTQVAYPATLGGTQHGGIFVTFTAPGNPDATGEAEVLLSIGKP